MPTIELLLSSSSVEEVIRPARVWMVSVTVCRAGVDVIANIAFYGMQEYWPLVIGMYCRLIWESLYAACAADVAWSFTCNSEATCPAQNLDQGVSMIRICNNETN